MGVSTRVVSPLPPPSDTNLNFSGIGKLFRSGVLEVYSGRYIQLSIAYLKTITFLDLITLYIRIWCSHKLGIGLLRHLLPIIIDQILHTPQITLPHKVTVANIVLPPSSIDISRGQ